VMGRGQRAKQNKRFLQSIAAEKETDSDDNTGPRPRKRRRKLPRTVNLDEGDNDFLAESSSSEESSDRNSDIEEITNEEVSVLHPI
jgi:hypothetical protein